MGCISSKLHATTDLDGEIRLDHFNHVVSLTSTTYGVLNLDPQGKEEEGKVVAKEWRPRPPPVLNLPLYKKRVVKEEAPEVIDAWKLMEDLEDETPIWSPLKKPTKPLVSIHLWSPAKAMASPRKKKARTPGKENSPLQQSTKRCDLDPNRVLRPFSPTENSKSGMPNSRMSRKNSPLGGAKIENLGADSGVSSSRRSLSPLFDPALLALIEKELHEEGEQVKKVVLASEPRTRKARDCDLLLKTFEEKCPPGGENSLVLYTTTLRGIRKTFEDCNAVRSAIEAYDVEIAERDISMDSGYREELRLLMDKKQVKVPSVFVKGRLIGGAEEILKLEEEGKLGLLLEGIPRAKTWCEGCGGVRFVMCMDCNGSCKVLNEEEKKMVKCEVCNENGLIHCPVCC
ncbi:uncharacterized protein [Typha angustifolia]|uniref:uncharacterized protein n=1 Tax=Typha angustifolia TaxID=59011 RepID=UPI003C2C8F25